MQATRYSLLIPILLLTLAACEPTLPRRGPPPEVIEGRAEATALASTGYYTDAAAVYRRLAATQKPPLQQELLLEAAQTLIAGGDWTGADALLVSLTSGPLTREQIWQQRLLHAETALGLEQPQRALDLLGPSPAQTLEADWQRGYYRLQAQALALLGRGWEQVEARIALDRWLAEEDRLDHQVTIIEAISLLRGDQLPALDLQPTETAGWIALAAILQEPGPEPEQVEARLSDWQQQYPGHPALEDLPQAWFEYQATQIYHPLKIAVLLPETGRFQWVARALRTGILAAYYNQPQDQRPSLRFYDSSDPTQIWPILQQAVAEGAEMVLGPLDKDAVTQLARAGELPVPVLALNRVPPEPGFAAELYQYALAPEDEARQVAEHAWSQGYRLALVLTPNGAWGERMEASFRERWLELGGIIADHQTYDPEQHDFSAPLQALLDLDLSRAREQSLQRLLGRRLEFEPRRRADGQFVFLAARPQPARALRPQLQFHHAADLPILASSHLFSGEPDPALDRDLEGVQFLDLPWLFGQALSPNLSQSQLAVSLPDFAPSLARFYAMGIDSYVLMPHLYQLHHVPGSYLEGGTGRLRLDRLNQVHRELIWAEFLQGHPRPIAPLAVAPVPEPAPTEPAQAP